GFTLLMPSHRWDPGIDGGVVLGKRNHKGRRDFLQISDVVDRVQEIGLTDFLEIKDICEWISILAIIPVNSHDYSGTGGLEWLTGKWFLWLVSLNQPQKTELIIETDLKGNHILAGADVRRLIWHVEEFGVFSRIASLLLEPRIFGRDMWRGRRESSRFFILVLLANDRVGDIGLSMFMFSGYWSYKGDAFIFLCIGARRWMYFSGSLLGYGNLWIGGYVTYT
ncbi:hypothetical protein HID58_096314, partial [Brassica napus]